jgi:peptidoglycan/LPS O-acetylase OafA/YrhL
MSFYLLYPLTFGWAGVSLFFVLSGFVIHYSTLHVGRFDVRGFYWRRFWRIWPPYVAVLAVVAFLQWRHAAPGVDRANVVRQFTVHAAALQNVRARYFFGINPSFWSLATEFQFYLLYPPLLMCRRRAGWGTALGLVLGVSTSFRVVAYAMTDWRGPMAPETVTWYATPALWPDWVLGMYLAERYQSGRRLFQRPGTWAGALAVLLVAASTFKPTSVLCFTIASVLGAVATEAAVWRRPGGTAVEAAAAGAGRRVGPLAGRALAGLGVVSYSFYLWHQPLLSKIFAWMRIASVRDPGARMVLLVCASLAVGSGASYLSYHLLERPSQDVGRQMARRLGI